MTYFIFWVNSGGEKKGLVKGLEKGNTAFVKYLLSQTNHTTEEIAELAEVPVKFVVEVKGTLR
jgi:hypothetical protein